MKTAVEGSTLDNRCPACQTVMDALVPARIHRGHTKPGDFAVCFACGEILRVAREAEDRKGRAWFVVKLRKLTRFDVFDFWRDAELAGEALRARQFVLWTKEAASCSLNRKKGSES